MEEEERERTTPTVAFDYGFLTQENADTFPIQICRDNRYGQTGATCCEPSTSALQDAVFQACAGVEVIPQGPLERSHGQGSCGNGCERSETTVLNSQDFR